MGILGLGSHKGIRCDPQPDGTLRCRIYKNQGKLKVATGTEWSPQLDENCDIQFAGQTDILDDDEEMVEKHSKQMVAACRKGIT